MMRRGWNYLLLGLVAWLFFLLWRMPALVAYDLAAETLDNTLTPAGIGGTVWRGEVQQLQLREYPLGRLNWQLSPWDLLVGDVAAEFALSREEASLQGRANAPFSGESVSLEALRGRIPLSLLQPHLAMIPLPLDGVVSLRLDQVEVAGDKPRLERVVGRIVWHQAGVLAPQPLAFGDLQIELNTDDAGAIEGKIGDSGGPLRLQAILTVDEGGDYRLKGKVGARASAPPALHNTLRMLGKADNEGDYPLNFSGRL